MSAPRWSRALLRRLSPDGREDEILGDLEEAHNAHVQARGRLVGGLVTALETLDIMALRHGPDFAGARQAAGHGQAQHAAPAGDDRHPSAQIEAVHAAPPVRADATNGARCRSKWRRSAAR